MKKEKKQPAIASKKLVANEFSRILREWLTPQEMDLVNKQNKLDKYDYSVCASHEFCDPNEAMIEAFEKIMGEELELQDSANMEIVNAAWQLAKKNHFKQLKL